MDRKKMYYERRIAKIIAAYEGKSFDHIDRMLRRSNPLTGNQTNKEWAAECARQLSKLYPEKYNEQMK